MNNRLEYLVNSSGIYKEIMTGILFLLQGDPQSSLHGDQMNHEVQIILRSRNTLLITILKLRRKQRELCSHSLLVLFLRIFHTLKFVDNTLNSF